MSFQAPLFLLGLVAVPLALAAQALAQRRAARYVVRFPALPTLAAVLPRPPRWRRLVPPALLCLALAGLALALARPEMTIAVPVERASVMLVTDTSGSMQATDVAPSRLAAARAAAERFVERVPDELQVGLVAYADGPHTVVAPTRDRAEVKAALDGLAAEGGTATGDALDRALRALGERGKDKPPAAVVLLSDGANQAGREPAAVARSARAAGVPVYTVALGTSAGAVTGPDGRRLAVPPDPAALAEVAQITGGRAFAAEDAGALDEVYERLGSRIGTRKEKREISAGFAAAGLVLLAGALGTSLRWRGRLP
jgi:Ca-activated chloride channel family protein